MNAHLIRDGKTGECEFAGSSLTEDPTRRSGHPRLIANVIVETGREFIYTHDGSLYILDPGPHQHTDWSANEIYIAARKGWFGFRIMPDGAAKEILSARN